MAGPSSSPPGTPSLFGSPSILPSFDPNQILLRILNVGNMGGRLTINIQDKDVSMCCFAVRQIFLKQPMLIEIDPPVVVCGDIHGQYSDLIRIFDKEGFPPDANFLFLGDYVDRGRHSLETILLLFGYKIKYPELFFLLRGNHECRQINRVYGFYDECMRRYKSQRMWEIFAETFAAMPISALIAGRILCMHGGLSPKLNSLDDIRTLPRGEPANPSLALDLLWADPEANTEGFANNTRGASVVFGVDVVMEACVRLELDLIARAHQVVQDGYEFFANRHLVTIFSAPHYCGQYNNSAATMKVDENMRCTFHVFSAGRQSVVKEEKPSRRRSMLGGLL